MKTSVLKIEKFGDRTFYLLKTVRFLEGIVTYKIFYSESNEV